MAEKKNSLSQLAKTQKIIIPGTHDEQAKKIIEDYKEIMKGLSLIHDVKQVNPIGLFLLRIRLRRLVQREFKLYKIFPESVFKERRSSSLEIVSSELQRDLYSASKSVSTKLNELVNRKIIQKKHLKEIYSYSLPPLRQVKSPKKLFNVFTSSSMKKKFY
jgi:hypothetical protein